MPARSLLIVVTALLAWGAACPPPSAAGLSFSVDAGDRGAVTCLSAVTVFGATVRNDGTEADTYTATMIRDLPAAWACSFCEGGTCYPPFVTAISFALQPGQETHVEVDLTPLADEGAGAVRVTFTSQGNPALAASTSYRVVTSGVEVLLVDGDAGAALEAHYEPALAAGDVSWARWPRDEAGALSAQELAGFAGIAWYASGMSPGLDDTDRASLAYYVQHGGRLLLAGQDLAWQACDPASPWQSASAAAWLQVVLGAGYAGTATGAIGVSGLPGAPFAGPAFTGTLNGPGGAGNSTAPDALLATGAGTPAQAYGNGQVAAVGSSWGDGRSLFCGYAPESLAPAETAQLVDGFLDWALGRASSLPAVAAAGGLRLRAAPNPFNPSTRLRFEVAAAGPVRVVVHDLGGRVVRALADRVMPAGPAELAWDGRDAGGRVVPSGTYLARVAAGGRCDTLKLVLAK